MSKILLCPMENYVSIAYIICKLKTGKIGQGRDEIFAKPCLPRVLMEWEIFEKVNGFLTKDSSMQTLDEAESLRMELQKVLFPINILETAFDEKEGVFKATRIRYAYEDMEMSFNLRQEIPDILDKFCIRSRELSCPTFPINLRPYLEQPREFIKKEGRDSAKKIRKFLNDNRVKNVLRLFASHKDQAFVVHVLEPETFGWMRREGDQTYTQTLCSSALDVVENTSKPGPKSRGNNAIILLTIHLKKCFKCSKDCKHGHPSIYQCIADLFNACGMENKNNWNKAQIDRRYDTIKKTFDKEWWQKHYEYELSGFPHSYRETGIFGLVRNAVHRGS